MGWSCKYDLKTSFSDPKIGLKWPKTKWAVTMATDYIWNWKCNFVYLHPKALLPTKYKKKIIFWPWASMSTIYLNWLLNVHRFVILCILCWETPSEKDCSLTSVHVCFNSCGKSSPGRKTTRAMRPRIIPVIFVF